MKTLIIGGAGFVGGYLADRLKQDGYDVIITKTEKEQVKGFDGKVYNMDLLVPEQIHFVLKNVLPDCIFHLAAQSSVAVSWKQPATTVDINIKGTIHLLDAVRELKINPRLLLIGSSEEYGSIKKEDLPVKEDNQTRPNNIYAVTKLCQNIIGTIYAQAYKMDILNIRAFNHLGPKQAETFVTADFCRQVAKIENGQQKPVIFVGNLSAKRDFTDVRDVVRAYSLLSKTGKSGETYNVGSGQSISIQEILDQILALTVVPIQVQIDKNKFRPVDMPEIEADIHKLTKTTGWIPQIPLKQTIQDTLEYWRRDCRNARQKL